MADLFDAAAERAALGSDRPASQERQRILGVDVSPAGPLFAQMCARCGKARALEADGYCSAFCAAGGR